MNAAAFAAANHLMASIVHPSVKLNVNVSQIKQAGYDSNKKITVECVQEAGQSRPDLKTRRVLAKEGKILESVAVPSNIIAAFQQVDLLRIQYLWWPMNA